MLSIKDSKDRWLTQFQVQVQDAYGEFAEFGVAEIQGANWAWAEAEMVHVSKELSFHLMDRIPSVSCSTRRTCSTSRTMVSTR